MIHNQCHIDCFGVHSHKLQHVNFYYFHLLVQVLADSGFEYRKSIYYHIYLAWTMYISVRTTSQHYNNTDTEVHNGNSYFDRTWITPLAYPLTVNNTQNNYVINFEACRGHMKTSHTGSGIARWTGRVVGWGGRKGRRERCTTNMVFSSRLVVKRDQMPK